MEILRMSHPNISQEKDHSRMAQSLHLGAIKAVIPQQLQPISTRAIGWGYLSVLSITWS